MPQRRLKQALHQFIENESGLLEYGVNERSLTHKLAEYLQPLFPNYHVDCEYNRDGQDDVTKRLNLPVRNVDTGDIKAQTVFPDIIVHQRGTRENLLVIEVKTSRNRTDDGEGWDRQKLEAFVDQMGYRYAAFVVLNVGTEPGYELDWTHPPRQ